MIDTSKETIKVIYLREYAGNKIGDTKFVCKEVSDNLLDQGVVKIIETIKTK